MPTSASILQILSFFVVSKAFLGNQKTLSTKVQVADNHKVQVADTTSFHINLLEKKREDQLTALRKTEIELATLAEECFVDPNNDDRCSSTSLPNILFDNNFGYGYFHHCRGVLIEEISLNFDTVCSIDSCET